MEEDIQKFHSAMYRLSPNRESKIAIGTQFEIDVPFI